MKMEGLIEDHEYLFRIRAVNAQGEGEPYIGPKEPVMAKDPFKLPGRPGKPFADDWDVDRIDLKWNPPRSDGGSAIELWIIEKKTKLGMWEKCAECPGPQPKGSMRSLTEGESLLSMRLEPESRVSPRTPSLSRPDMSSLRLTPLLF